MKKKNLIGKDHRKKWSKKQLKIWSKAPDIFRNLIKNKKMTFTQFCLLFCTSFRSVSTTIPGMMSQNHVKENLKVGEFKSLTNREIDEIYYLYKSHSWINLTNKKNV